MRVSIPTRLSGIVEMQQAQAALTAAGYSGVQCHEEKVYFPFTDPNTGLSYYTQEICTAPGFTGSFDVDIVNMSRPGTGVDLAAERKYLLAHGDGPGTGDYAFTNAPNTVITSPIIGAGGQQYTALNVGSSDPAVYQQKFNAADKAAADMAAKGAIPPKNNSSNTAPGGSAGTAAVNLNFDFESLGLKDLFSNKLVWIGGAAVLLMMTMGGKR